MNAAHIDIDAIGPDGAELARYRTSAGERVLMGWPQGAGLEVTDRPVEGRARAYLVERGLLCSEQVGAFLGDYVNEAVRLDCCPMAAEALGAMLEETESGAVDHLAAAISSR